MFGEGWEGGRRAGRGGRLLVQIPKLARRDHAGRPGQVCGAFRTSAESADALNAQGVVRCAETVGKPRG